MLKFGLKLVTGPAAEPVTLDQAKQHLRVEYTDDDALISVLIGAAREHVEHVVARAIYDQTWCMTLDCFPSGDSMTLSPQAQQTLWLNSTVLSLPVPRLKAVSSIVFLDLYGQTQTLAPAAYVVDANSEPARIAPVNGTSWPTPNTYVPGSIKITFIAGSFGDGIETDTCPASIKQAMLLLIGHLYANREAAAEKQLFNLPLAFDALLSAHKFYGLVVA